MEKVEVLPNKRIFIGQEVIKELKSIGLTPDSVQMKWFYEKVKTFHLTAVKFLQKYFKVALSDDAMENMTGLDPKKQGHFLTPIKLNSLSTLYSKVIDNIEPFGGLNKVQEEIRIYVVDDDIKDLDKNDFENFWKNVGNQKDGDWRKYEILPRFALAMGTKNSATGDVERSFSSMNLIHQNRQRNCMHQDTLDAHLHIRSAVESEENIRKCQKCDGVSYDHCHCLFTVISAEMKANCKKAREKCWKAQKESSNIKEHEKESNLDKYNEALASEKERIRKLKEKLMTKSDFLSSSLMKSVYEKEKVKSSNKDGRSGGSKEKDNKGSGEDARRDKGNKEGTWEKDSRPCSSQNKGKKGKAPESSSAPATKKQRKLM